MADEKEDFWPADIVAAADPEPVALLKEQAALLGQKTGNDVEGVVKASTEAGKAFYSLYLKAPALGDYQYKLLSIAYPVTSCDEVYPITAQTPAGGPAVEIKSREEFRGWLREQLSSEHVRRVINNLLGVIRDAPQFPGARHIREALETAKRLRAPGSSPGG
jgi:hypothetical protein